MVLTGKKSYCKRLAAILEKLQRLLTEVRLLKRTLLLGHRIQTLIEINSFDQLVTKTVVLNKEEVGVLTVSMSRYFRPNRRP